MRPLQGFLAVAAAFLPARISSLPRAGPRACGRHGTALFAGSPSLDDLLLSPQASADEALAGASAAPAISASQAARLIDICAQPAASVTDPVTGDSFSPAELAGFGAAATAEEERRLLTCYASLASRGLAPLFGAARETPLPVPSGWRMSPDDVPRTTDLPLAAFRPAPGSGQAAWALGVALCAAEIALARAFGLAPGVPLFATGALAALDTAALGGALSEKAGNLIFRLGSGSAGESGAATRVVRHEAGHLLLAHLLGCPVQGVSLSAWDQLLGRGSLSGRTDAGGAATAFFDQELNAAARRGQVSRGVVDRHCIVLMGGIAAEAMVYGAAEGGKDDERALTAFLRETIGAGFAGGAVSEQARWSAVNALLLLRRYRGAYDRLVDKLEADRGSSIGECIMALEGM